MKIKDATHKENITVIKVYTTNNITASYIKLLEYNKNLKMLYTLSEELQCLFQNLWVKLIEGNNDLNDMTNKFYLIITELHSLIIEFTFLSIM
jgi:ABC-type uncharacterized transport system permease subunit